MSGPALAAVLLAAFAVGILAGILADSALRRWRVTQAELLEMIENGTLPAKKAIRRLRLGVRL
jgi:hypothetical protein